MNKIAIVRIRGKAGVNRRIEETLCRMRLYNKYHCVIISNDKRNIGMFKRVKDYVTWGEIDKNTLTKLIAERGRLPGNKKLNESYIKEKAKTDVKEFSEMVYEGKKEIKDVPGLKPYFRLKPPLKGFERGGIKKPFSMGGVLGYRKNMINDLIQRMI